MLRRVHYRIINTDRDENEAILALLALARCVNFTLDPATLDLCLRQHDHYLVMEAN